MKHLILSVFVWLSFAGIALAEKAAKVGGYMDGEYIQDPDKFNAIINNLPSWAPVLISILVCVMIVFRAASEVILLMADKIPGDQDKKIARYLKSIATWIGKLLGQIGVGLPKRMVLEKAEKEIQNGN